MNYDTWKTTEPDDPCLDLPDPEPEPEEDGADLREALLEAE